MGTKIKVKRIYDPPSDEDGVRILVDRLWPRGMSKERAGVDLWLKEIAPSRELRKWFDHRPERWPEFKQKYYSELDQKGERVALVMEHARTKPVTLLFAAKEEHLNNAVAFKEYLEQKSRRKG